jgi:hypothetical protein
MSVTRKISKFCQVLSIWKPIAEIPPHPPLCKGGQGGFLGDLFRKLSSPLFSRELKGYGKNFNVFLTPLRSPRALR